MKKGDLKKNFFELLNKKIAPYDFSLARRMDWFIKRGTASLIYQLSFYDSGSGYEIEPALAVRIDEVEKIFHLVFGFDLKYQKENSPLKLSNNIFYQTEMCPFLCPFFPA